VDFVLWQILKLVAIRIKTLCERLKCSEQFLENVYWLIQQILSERTSIFFNRHIDQIILCSIYGVAKVCLITLTSHVVAFDYPSFSKVMLLMAGVTSKSDL